MCQTATMNDLIQRIAAIPGLTVGCVAILCWVLAGFALADPDLSANEPLGGSKALFIVLALLMTGLTIYKSRIFTNRD